jgi:molecular chaperone Hsp33
MLQESRLYSFIDQSEGFTLHFLEGQKLVHDLALTHKIVGEGFHFFRDITLSTQLLLAFLKSQEGLGIYIDSNEPYFKFKLEMNDSGQMRSLLLPEEFKVFPKHISGQCRLSKFVTSEHAPYVSVVDLQNTALSEIINKLLKDSYQLDSQVFLSEESDQSILISKLPNIDINKIETHYSLTTNDYWQKHEKSFMKFFSEFPSDYSIIQNFFEEKGLLLLASREVKFKCTCSRERMSAGLWSLIKSSGIDQVFLPDENEIETTCDYCHTAYLFPRKEFLT